MLHLPARLDATRWMPMQAQDQSQGTERQEKLRADVRAWLQGIMDKYRMSQRGIGIRSGVSPATINRAMDENGSFVMSFSVMSKISDAFGEPLPEALAKPGAQARPVGFSESDLVDFTGSVPGLIGQGVNNHGVWRIVSHALDLEGFRPGDVLDFDLGLKPVPGDIVVAQVYNLHRGTADTVLRVYYPPYLLTRSNDPAIDPRPLYIDNERIVVMGTFVRMLRERAA